MTLNFEGRGAGCGHLPLFLNFDTIIFGFPVLHLVTLPVFNSIRPFSFLRGGGSGPGYREVVFSENNWY